MIENLGRLASDPEDLLRCSVAIESPDPLADYLMALLVRRSNDLVKVGLNDRPFVIDPLIKRQE